MNKTFITIALIGMSTIATAQTYTPPPSTYLPPSHSYRPLVEDLDRKKEWNRYQDEQRINQQRKDDDQFRNDLYKRQNDYYGSRKEERSVFNPPPYVKED